MSATHPTHIIILDLILENTSIISGKKYDVLYFVVEK
jgi:hypothetical protein